MKSYENIIKLEEMRRKVVDGDYFSAYKILDTMEIRKIKNIVDLNLIAEVYAENEYYDKAGELYAKIYNKTKSRKSLYQLIEALIKNNDVENAEFYLAQYEKIARNDIYVYVFRYKLEKLKGESYEKLIEILKELKEIEYTEQWAYELAKLYYKAGMEEECIRECSDIILWFGEGVYVEKAKILRSYYSGEADKESIMEEIRRRAEYVNSILDPNSDTVEEDEMNTAEISTVEQAEDLFYTADFSADPEEEELKTGLMEEIQGILTQDGEQNELPEEKLNEEPEEELNEEPDEKQDIVRDEIQDEMPEEVSEEVHKEQQMNKMNHPELSEAERAEMEVENTIYRLLEEDKVDGDENKLRQLATNHSVNLDEIFGNFLHNNMIKKQLVKALENITSDNKTVFIIITGTEGSGKTTLAKDFALFLHKTDRLQSSKVAKISGEKLNSIDLKEKKEILRSCCLLVERASDLKRKTIENLLQLTQELQGDIALIFEDNKKNMNKLFRECPKLMDLLRNRIHLPQYKAEDLPGFAYACLKLKDYTINAEAEAELKSRINDIIKHSKPHEYLQQIDSLMQAAINKADIRMGKQLTQLATQGRLHDMESLSVIAEDFTDQI